jgi:hypothetical protein
VITYTDDLKPTVNNDNAMKNEESGKTPVEIDSDEDETDDFCAVDLDKHLKAFDKFSSKKIFIQNFFLVFALKQDKIV